MDISPVGTKPVCVRWCLLAYLFSLLVNIGLPHYRCFVVCVCKKGKVLPCTGTLRLCAGRMAHKGSRGIALLFLDHSTRRGWGVSITPWLLFTSGRDPVPVVQEAGWAPGLVWTGAENLAPTRIRSPGRPVRSQSLHWHIYIYMRQIAYEPVGSFVWDWFEHYRGILILYIPCLMSKLTYITNLSCMKSWLDGLNMSLYREFILPLNQ